MKVTIEIPQSRIKAVAALVNMEGKLTDEQKLAVADFMFPRHPKGIELVDDLTDEAKDWALRRILGLAEARPLEQKLDLGDNLLPCDKPAVPRLKPLEGGKIPRIPDDVLVKLKEKEKEIMLNLTHDEEKCLNELKGAMTLILKKGG